MTCLRNFLRILRVDWHFAGWQSPPGVVATLLTDIFTGVVRIEIEAGETRETLRVMPGDELGLSLFDRLEAAAYRVLDKSQANKNVRMAGKAFVSHVRGIANQRRAERAGHGEQRLSIYRVDRHPED